MLSNVDLNDGEASLYKLPQVLQSLSYLQGGLYVHFLLKLLTISAYGGEFC